MRLTVEPTAERLKLELVDNGKVIDSASSTTDKAKESFKRLQEEQQEKAAGERQPAVPSDEWDLPPIHDIPKPNTPKSGGTVEIPPEKIDDLLHIAKPGDIIELDPGEIRNLWNKKPQSEPTEEERKKAEEMATEQLRHEDLCEVLSKEDQELLERMQNDLLDGNLKDLAEIVKRLQSNPEHFKRMAEYVQNNLRELGAKINLDVTEGGSLLVYKDFGTHAVEIAADGSTKNTAIEMRLDGSVDILTNRQALKPTPQQLAKQIADEAVIDIARKPEAEVVLPAQPLDPDPSWVFPEKKPSWWNPGLFHSDLDVHQKEKEVGK